MSDFSKFLEIRKQYARLLPCWMSEYESTGEMRHDPYFMEWDFSPIERLVWSDIRSNGIPFFPQVPVLNYFLDFANPFLKIGIECDGKAWHNHDMDKARDARLADEGWMIFRIEGHECKREIQPWSECSDDQDDGKINRYFMETSEGVINAIRRKYFEDDLGPHAELIDWTLFEHRSTPETYPVRRPYTKPTKPIHFADALEQWIHDFMLRAAA